MCLQGAPGISGTKWVTGSGQKQRQLRFSKCVWRHQRQQPSATWSNYFQGVGVSVINKRRKKNIWRILLLRTLSAKLSALDSIKVSELPKICQQKLLHCCRRLLFFFSLQFLRSAVKVSLCQSLGDALALRLNEYLSPAPFRQRGRCNILP